MKILLTELSFIKSKVIQKLMVINLYFKHFSESYILEYRIYLGCYLLSMHPMYVPISTSHKIFKLRTACNIATISIVPMPYIIEEFF